jgi:hypothetical protein
MDANASTSRLLTQLILKPSDPSPESFKVDLSPALPSIGEALAVLSGCTLLLSMLDTPFVMFWVRVSFPSISHLPARVIRNAREPAKLHNLSSLSEVLAKAASLR